MGVPYIPLIFDNEDAEKSALQLAYALDPSWKDSEGEVEIVRLTDGITNTLAKATKHWPGKTLAEIDDGAILMRAYGKGSTLR